MSELESDRPQGEACYHPCLKQTRLELGMLHLLSWQLCWVLEGRHSLCSMVPQASQPELHSLLKRLCPHRPAQQVGQWGDRLLSLGAVLSKGSAGGSCQGTA